MTVYAYNNMLIIIAVFVIRQLLNLFIEYYQKYDFFLSNNQEDNARLFVKSNLFWVC